MQNKSKELEVAIKAALEAGKILEKYFETEMIRETKEDTSIMTVADSESEHTIKKILLESFPTHSILGEETGHTKNSSSYTWVVDPLDGTRNFANGIPLFAVSICLEREKELLVGVVYNPATRSLFCAEKGKGAYLNDKRIFVSKNGINKTTLSIAASQKDLDKKKKSELCFGLFPKVVSSIRDLGCTSLELSYIATGAMEAAIRLGLRTYDFSAGVLLVTEAGGKITTLDGSTWEFPEDYFLISNGVAHDLLIEGIKKI